MKYAELLEAVREIAREAGKAILEVYEGGEALDVRTKEDDSPVTRADMAAHEVIVERLSRLTPDIPVLSEESAGIGTGERQQWSRFWLVDPLDGTKEFLNRNGEFTVNIALVEEHRPVLGVVHVPLSGTCYLASPDTGALCEEGGERRAIRVREVHRPVVMVASRRHATETLDALEQRITETLGPVERTSMGSSLKICLVAEGRADLYPRLGPTSEWDTAAAHAVVRAAGGHLVNTEFRELEYNRRDTLLNPHFLVLGQPPAFWDFLRPALAEH